VIIDQPHSSLQDNPLMCNSYSLAPEITASFYN